jgi:hypothetical protein
MVNDKHRKSFSISLATREMQIKTTRDHFHPHPLGWLESKITRAGKDVEKLEALCIAGGNSKWCSCCGKQFGSSSKC